MEAAHIQNRGILAQMLAQRQSSSSEKKRGRLATDVTSGPIILTKYLCRLNINELKHISIETVQAKAQPVEVTCGEVSSSLTHM